MTEILISALYNYFTKRYGKIAAEKYFSILDVISYHAFEAAGSLVLVQGDARDGIWLTLPDGKILKTYLFVWIDDYSRKILYAEYYRDEKLPRMEDSFKKMILRLGLPEKIYLDNGHVYSSRHFAWLLAQ